MQSEITAVIARLRALGAELADVDLGYPAEPATFDEGASEPRISTLEGAVGDRLPDDYRAFLLECAGIIAMDFFNGYVIHAPELVARLLKERGPPKHLLVQGSKKALLAIGGDGGGNLFLLELSDPCRVWKWNHESMNSSEAATPSSSELSLVSTGFPAFLERIAA